MRLGLVALLFVLTVFSSCEVSNVFERNVDVPNYSWSGKNKLKFEVSITDTTSLYNVYINTRHLDTYEFRNLWVIIYTKFPDGTMLQERKEIPLATDEGQWYGEGMGDVWDKSFQIQQNALFKKPGIYTFELEQNMRKDPLRGIMAMGFRIERVGGVKPAAK